MAKSPTDRRVVEMCRKRIPLKKLLNGKELRDGIADMEKFRQSFNEYEFLYGAKIMVQCSPYDGEVNVIVRRPETDKELATRLEKAREAAEAKKAREEKKKLQDRIRKEEALKAEREGALATIRRIAQQQKLSEDDLVDLLNN